MSKAEKKVLRGLKEALAHAKGEKTEVVVHRFAARRKLTADQLRDLFGSVRQTVTALMLSRQSPTAEGGKMDALLLDILSDPDRKTLPRAKADLKKIADYYRKH